MPVRHRPDGAPFGSRRCRGRNLSQPTPEELRIDLFGTLEALGAELDEKNVCSIVAEPPAPPLGGIAKKKKLLRDDQAARAAERLRTGIVAPPGE